MRGDMKPSALLDGVPIVDAVQSARIERLHDWFALQLHFAEEFESRTGLPLDTVVTFYTNLHRRFGFGRPSKEDSPPEWEAFVRRLAAFQTRAQRIDFTKAFARERLVNWSGTGERQFGCFSFEPPKEGVIRIHFSPNDTQDGIGPLARQKCSRRVDELAKMFAFIRREHGVEGKYVAGGSWLYNLDAYKRLFPSAYIASLRIHTKPNALFGGSWWGQFVDHRENVVADRVATFSENLRCLDSAEVWKVFPLPAMTALAKVDDFHERYGT
jgi:hypothetical protein